MLLHHLNVFIPCSEYQWASCPNGYFLSGLFRNAGNQLFDISKGYCCRPKNHPDRYGLCYEEDVGELFNKAGWSGCLRPGHYITGIYRGNGSWLNSIDRFNCCQMATGTEHTT